MPEVTMPNGDIVVFPDDMPKAQIRSLIEKKFPNAQREALAVTGKKPYQGALEGAVTGVQNMPATIQEMFGRVDQFEGDLRLDMLDPRKQVGKTPPLQVTPGAPIADLLNQPAAVTLTGKPEYDPSAAPGAQFGDTLHRNIVDAIPGDLKKSWGMDAAKLSVGGQLRVMDAQRRQAENPIDTKPGSWESYVAAAAPSALESTGALAVSLLARNPAPFVTWFTARGGAEGYGKAKDAGTSNDEARLVGGLYAMADAVTEAVAGKVFMEGGKTLVRSVLKGVGAEGLTEGVAETLKVLVDLGVVKEDMTLDDAVSRIKDSAIISGIAGGPVAAAGHGLRKLGKMATPGIQVNEPVTPEAEKPAEPEVAPQPTPKITPETSVENVVGRPGADTILALPSPEMFKPPEMFRRQPTLSDTAETRPTAKTAGLPTQDELPVLEKDMQWHGATLDRDTSQVKGGWSPDQIREYEARVAMRATKQKETAELLQTAKETVSPLGIFTVEDVGGQVAQRVIARRIQLGRDADAPITVAELAGAKVPQSEIDRVISARRPMTSADPLTALTVVRAAQAKNIITEDENFAELAYRSTGQRDLTRMSQAQLNALKSVVDTMPAHAERTTLPIVEDRPFTDKQYESAVQAVRKAGRYTQGTLTEATGLKSKKDLHALRDTMVRRGQLVKRGAEDYRLYDVIGKEKQTTPADLPEGAFKEHTVKRVPVSAVEVRQNGKVVGSFASASEARDAVNTLRAAELKAGKPRSEVAIKETEKGGTAWGVFENRYDENGNYLGQAVVSTAKDETAARKVMAELNGSAELAEAPDLEVAAPTPIRKPPTPEALAGRLPEILKSLNAQARERKLPLLGVKVTLRDEIRAPDGERVEGVHLGKLIEIATTNLTTDMSTDQIVEKIGQVMDHESIHALRKADVLGPDTDGWRTIVRYAKRAKRPGAEQTYFEWAKERYQRPGNPAGPLPGYNTPDSIEEEAIAEAFRHWAANRRNVVGKPATVFNQLIEWFRRLFNSVPTDLFTSIENGSLVEQALRPPGSNMPRATATREMQEAAGVVEAAATADPAAAQKAGRVFVRARSQARDDRYGKSGPKTVLGTTPTKAYATGEIADRAAVQAIADKYRQDTGLTTGRLETYLPLDSAYLKRVADAQGAAPHAPRADAVQKAYGALVSETKGMFRALGPLEVTAWKEDGEPYDSPAAVIEDALAGRLRMRLSNDMFGPGADNPGHPFNVASGIATIGGESLSVNDLFRVVHDVFGHGQSGFRDTAAGRYNAYHEHARLLSPEARRALATETLAQGAWFDFGKHLRRTDGTVPRETDSDYLADNFKEFAEQKAFLLPADLIAADPGWAIADQAADAEVPKFSVFEDQLPGGALYGKTRSPGGLLAKAGTPAAQFSAPGPNNQYFGGEFVDEQLRMAREGERGTTMLYMQPDDFLALAGEQPANPEQDVLISALQEGYKASTLPSLVTDGYAGNVRVTAADGVDLARSFDEAIPVIIYPKKGESLGLVTALERGPTRVPFSPRQENYPDARPDSGPKYSVTAAFGQRMPEEPRYAVNDRYRPKAVKEGEAYDLFSGATGPVVEEDTGEATPPERRNFNIVNQRVDGWVGKWINSIARSKRHIPFIGSIFDLRIKFQDSWLSVKELLEYAKANGGWLPDDFNPYVLQQAAGDRAIHGITEREKSLYEPLLKSLKDFKAVISLEQFEDGLMARHAPERNAYLRTKGSPEPNPSGMSDGEAQAIIDSLMIDKTKVDVTLPDGTRLQSKLDVFKHLAAMFDQITANTTETRVAGGLIAKGTTSPYQFYAPLRNAFDTIDPDDPLGNQARPRSGKGYNVSGAREDRKSTGRHDRAGDIIAHAILQNTESVIRSEKARVGQAFVRFVLENRELMRDHVEIVTDAPKKRTVGSDGRIKEIVDPNYKSNEDNGIFVTKANGKEFALRIKDTRLLKALKSGNTTQLGELPKLLGKWSRYQAAVNTSLNPIFIPTNFLRDIQGAVVTAQQYDIPGFTRSILGGTAGALRGVGGVLFKDKVVNKYGAAFKEMQANGWTTEFMGVRDLQTVYNKIKKDTSDPLKVSPVGLRRKIKLFFDFVENVNKVAENALRVSAYVAAREKGASITQAGYLAKNLTVNFSKGGELRPVMNATYIFFNAGVGGTAVAGNAVKNKRARRMLIAVTVFSFGLDVVNRLLSGDGDDEREPNGVKDYDEIDAFIKNTNTTVVNPLSIMDPGVGIEPYLSIPMPHGYNIAAVLGRSLSEMVSGSPRHSIMSSGINLLASTVNALNVMGGTNSFLNFVSPTVMDPFVDLGTNLDHTGNSIVPPQPAFGVEKPQSQLFWSTTDKPFVHIAEFINSLGGGNAVRPSPIPFMDTSPEVYEYLYEYVTGGVGRFLQQAATLGVDAAWGTLEQDLSGIDFEDIPGVNRLARKVGNRVNTEMFHENRTDVQRVAAEIEMAKEKKDFVWLNKVYTEKGQLKGLIDDFEEATKELTALRKKRDAALEKATLAKDKRYIEERYQALMDREMAQANRKYFERMKPAAPVKPVSTREGSLLGVRG